jgi:hypothetical protein
VDAILVACQRGANFSQMRKRLWKKELEGLMMPLIESYSATLRESAPDVFDVALAAAQRRLRLCRV